MVERHRLGSHVGGGADNQSTRYHLRRIVRACLAQALVPGDGIFTQLGPRLLVIRALDLCIVRRAGALWFSLAVFHWFESAKSYLQPREFVCQLEVL